MAYVNINELGEAAYNELIRIEFIDAIQPKDLSIKQLKTINEKIYNKFGDLMLNQVIKYKNCKPEYIDPDFNKNGAYIMLILMLALCYANKMNLNDFFELKVKYL